MIESYKIKVLSEPIKLAFLYRIETEMSGVTNEIAGLTIDAPNFIKIIDGIHQLAWMAKPDGFIYWYNRRWYEYTGTTPQDMEGWGWQSVHDPQMLPAVLERWMASIANGIPFEMEFPLRAADGSFHWFLTLVMPTRDEQGEIVLWFGTNTEIDRLRTAEAAVKLASEEKEQLFFAERKARAEAERQSQLKDEFLATLSHELRTPLNAILGWSQPLAHEEGASNSCRDGLAVIERNARAQTQIINDLLDMSRIISGKVRIDVQRVELSTVINTAVESVQPAADAKGIRIEKVLDSLAGPIAGDPLRLQQILWNLLANAVKFTDRGGRVQVLLERVNSHVEITVSDTGSGISPEFLPHVFDKFRQADSSTTRRTGGLGLGLAIVRNLVELHGGKVRAKSPGGGKGSSFIVEFPLPMAHGEHADEDRHHGVVLNRAMIQSAPCENVPDLTNVTILVVDDERDARELAKRILTKRGAIVHSAASVDEAEQLLDKHKFTVIVSDIGMPERDGYDFIRKVRARQPEAGGVIPAVAVTAFARSDDRRKALMAGFDMHVAKPVESSELLAVVSRLSQQNRA